MNFKKAGMDNKYHGKSRVERSKLASLDEECFGEAWLEGMKRQDYPKQCVPPGCSKSHIHPYILSLKKKKHISNT